MVCLVPGLISRLAIALTRTAHLSTETGPSGQGGLLVTGAVERETLQEPELGKHRLIKSVVKYLGV